MKTFLTILSAIFFLTSSVYANNGVENKSKKTYSISGKVIDFKEHLTGVKVILDGKETIVYTDFDGNFTINNVVEGEHTVSFSLITYDNKVVTFNPKNNSDFVIELMAK